MDGDGSILGPILMAGLPVVYILLAFVLTYFVRFFLIPSMNPYYRIGILSIFYALIFGVGLIEVGTNFYFPYPIIIALFVSQPDLILREAILSFTFWWSLIFILMIIRYKMKRRKENKKNFNQINYNEYY